MLTQRQTDERESVGFSALSLTEPSEVVLCQHRGPAPSASSGPRLLPGKKHESPVEIILKFYDPRGAFLRIRRRGEGVEESQLFKVIEIRSNGV